MNDHYHAYEAYERRVMRGEFARFPENNPKQRTPREPILTQLGDLLIQTGMRLKVRNAARNPMTWSASMGGKP